MSRANVTKTTMNANYQKMTLKLAGMRKRASVKTKVTKTTQTKNRVTAKIAHAVNVVHARKTNPNRLLQVPSLPIAGQMGSWHSHHTSRSSCTVGGLCANTNDWLGCTSYYEHLVH